MYEVKCKWCKKSSNKNTMHAVKIGARNSYFCNKSEYELFNIQKEIIDKEKNEKIELTTKFNELYTYIAVDILDYDMGQITPPNLRKRIRKLNENYDFEVIKLCVESMSKDLKYYISNKEMDERYMVNYFMVVIESNINDAYRTWKRKSEMVDKSKKLEEDLSIFYINHESVNREIKNSKSKDISSFLTEDDL